MICETEEGAGGVIPMIQKMLANLGSCSLKDSVMEPAPLTPKEITPGADFFDIEDAKQNEASFMPKKAVFIFLETTPSESLTFKCPTFRPGFIHFRIFLHSK
ncbi:MAG: hypothetical protein LBE27_07200 [Deltaproteobacteria bacterium]|nr:hypothetical protein [Deltaproteobacteria bacterium]